MQESQMSLQNDNNNNDDDFDPAVTHDDFLDQMLSGLQTTVTWPDISTVNGQNQPWDVDDHSAFLSSKLRQHLITTTPNAARTPAKPLQLTRGLTSPPIGDNNAIQNLFHGFTSGSLSTNQTQQFPGQNFGAAVIQTASATVASGGGGGGTPSQPRQRVRARRGQATDPHSIAERLRRERIAERMKALQELVPNANKTDKASMLDEIIDYVRFLQLQVKVLSMSRLGGAASNVTNPVVAEGGARSSNGRTSSTNNETTTVTENQVVKLMEEDMGSAMQYLQGKGLCLMPISLATAISNATCHPTSSRNNLPLGGEGGGPSSPNISVLTVQSANGVLVKDSP